MNWKAFLTALCFLIGSGLFIMALYCLIVNLCLVSIITLVFSILAFAFGIGMVEKD